MTFEIDKDTERFIRNLPKTETHLHIEGALPMELLRKVAPERYSAEPSWWNRDYRFPSFAAFESDLLAAAGHWYTSPERYHEAAKVVFDQLVYKQNVHYVETSFASGMMDFHGIDGKATAEAIKAAAPKGLQVRVFMGIHHDGYHEGNQAWLTDALTWEALDGIDLHGAETVPLGGWAEGFWQRARDAGKVTKAHAGEFQGPDFIRRVVDGLGVSRVQHGVRAIESDDLVRHLANNDITLDVCPISNVKLQVVSDYSEHPILQLMQAGVRCTLSTDDPLVFGNSLLDDYSMLASECGFDKSELARVARAGFEVAIMPEDERSRWLADFDQIVADSLGIARPALRKV